MTFKNQVKNDAKDVVLAGNSEFEESITYTPNGGSPLTINAIVMRRRAGSEGPGELDTVDRKCEIYIANDSTAGVESVDVGDDLVSLPIHYGEDPVSWRVTDVLHTDDGMWHLLLQR